MENESHIDLSTLPVHKPDPGLWSRIEVDLDVAGMAETAGQLPQYTAAAGTWRRISVKLFLLKYGWVIVTTPVITGAVVLAVWFYMTGREPRLQQTTTDPPTTEQLNAEPEEAQLSQANPETKSGTIAGTLHADQILPGRQGRETVSHTLPQPDQKTVYETVAVESAAMNHSQESTQPVGVLKNLTIPALPGSDIRLSTDPYRQVKDQPAKTRNEYGTEPLANRLLPNNPQRIVKEMFSLGAGYTWYQLGGRSGFASSRLNSLGQYDVFITYTSGNWMLQSGIAFSGFSDTLSYLADLRIDRVITYEYVDSVQFSNTGQIISYYTHLVSFHDSLEGNQYIKATVDHSLISVPLLAGKYWNYGNISMGLKGGLVFSYLSAHGKRIGMPDDPSVSVIKLKQMTSPQATTNLALEFSAEAAWRFTGHLGISVAPTLRYYTKPMFRNPTPDIPSPLLYGIKAALFYEF